MALPQLLSFSLHHDLADPNAILKYVEPRLELLNICIDGLTKENEINKDQVLLKIFQVLFDEVKLIPREVSACCQGQLIIHAPESLELLGRIFGLEAWDADLVLGGHAVDFLVLIELRNADRVEEEDPGLLDPAQSHRLGLSPRLFYLSLQILVDS